MPSAAGISVVVILVAAALTTEVSAYPTYQALIPNGDAVRRHGVVWPGVGHMNLAGGGELNPFGRDFKEHGQTWLSICQLDSDGDGATNGEELGDPNCQWAGEGAPARTSDISHPGFADSVPVGIAVPSRPPTYVLGSIVFEAVFVDGVHFVNFTDREDVFEQVTNNATLSLEFRFQSSMSLADAFDKETGLMTLSSAARRSAYGITSLQFPTTAPTTEAPSITTDTVEPIPQPGSLRFTMLLSFWHHYRSMDGQFRHRAAPSGERLKTNIGIALGVSSSRVILHGDHHIVPFYYGSSEEYAWLALFSIDSNTTNSGVERSVDDTYRLLLGNKTKDYICGGIPGCLDISWMASAALTSSETIASDGDSTYADEKLQFLIGIILALVVQVVILGYLWVVSQTAGRTLMSSKAKAQQTLPLEASKIPAAPTGLHVPDTM